MRGNRDVQDYVAKLVVPEHERLSMSDVADQDKEDAKKVVANLNQFSGRVTPIVEQLKVFSKKDFPVEFERNYRRGLAKMGGAISIDYATLNKPLSELALTLAHEWGHQSLGHLRNDHFPCPSDISEQQAEHEADYFGGLFLGFYGYDLEEVLKSKLSLPEGDSKHGTRYERACIITQGYCDGQLMKSGQLQTGFWPGFEAYRAQFGMAPWNQPKESHAHDSKARKSAK